MTASNDAAETPRTKTGEGAWLEAKRAIADRNDQARKTGKAERSAREENQKAQMLRSERNGVYR
jgi:hypothetical protein